MIRCQNCSAPLSGFQGRCGYCGSYNNVDRDLLMKAPMATGDSGFACPACGGAMKNMDLGKDGDASVCADQCGTCYGYFFPFFKLDVVLKDLSKYGLLIDTNRLDDLSRNAPHEPQVAYRKCPVCSKLMNRINFGKRSGVVTDQCHGHGIWLDAGELQRLVEWRNSGGMMVDEEYRRQAEREQEKRRKRDQERERARKEADRASRGGLFPG